MAEYNPEKQAQYRLARRHRLRKISQAVSENKQAPPELSPYEEPVFALLILGKTNRAIATHLDLAYGTVKNHVSVILRKYGVGGRAQLLAKLGRNCPKPEINIGRIVRQMRELKPAPPLIELPKGRAS
jgi:DNA-binding NarL/FixJ family response regulator